MLIVYLLLSAHTFIEKRNDIGAGQGRRIGYYFRGGAGATRLFERSLSTMAMLLFFFLLGVFPLVASQGCPVIQQSELEGMDGLIALTYAVGDADAPSVTVNNFNVVCLAASSTQDQYRYVSVVVSYSCSGNQNCNGDFVSQFDFLCSGGAWGSVFTADNSLTDPADGSLTTPIRTNCSFCVKPEVGQMLFLNVLPETETHCARKSDLVLFHYNY